MHLQSIIRRARSRARRLIPLAIALLLAALVATPASNIALAQSPPGESPIVLVNADRDFVERKEKGDFVARPIFDREIEILYYGIRDADTGDWLTAMYRVRGGEKNLREGWEYSFEYPALNDHPDLDPDRAYLLVMLAGNPGTQAPATFYTVVPFHEPGRIWDKILSALNPGRWARALAVWVVEGVHGTLCGVVERASGEDAANCRGG